MRHDMLVRYGKIGSIHDRASEACHQKHLLLYQRHLSNKVSKFHFSSLLPGGCGRTNKFFGLTVANRLPIVSHLTASCCPNVRSQRLALRDL